MPPGWRAIDGLFFCPKKRPIGAVTEDGPMERKRLVADRFRRIWAMVEDIAETPGKSRRELADTFHLSERQVQADLMMIRTDMRLPLVRRQGYRFVAEGPANGAGTFDLREAQLLVMILRQSMKDRSI